MVLFFRVKRQAQARMTGLHIVGRPVQTCSFSARKRPGVKCGLWSSKVRMVLFPAVTKCFTILRQIARGGKCMAVVKQLPSDSWRSYVRLREMATCIALSSNDEVCGRSFIVSSERERCIAIWSNDAAFLSQIAVVHGWFPATMKHVGIRFGQKTGQGISCLPQAFWCAQGWCRTYVSPVRLKGRQGHWMLTLSILDTYSTTTWTTNRKSLTLSILIPTALHLNPQP